MTADLTDLHTEMLRVLLDKGGDQGLVRWVRLALRVKGAGQVLADPESRGLVTKADKGAPNPGFQLTAAGVAEARKAFR